MRLLVTYFMLFAISVQAAITPPVELPVDFDESRFMVRTIKNSVPSGVYIQETEECNIVNYRDYFFVTLGRVLPPTLYGDEPANIPITEWFCLFSHGIYEVGYNPGTKEKVVYDKKKKLWVIKRNNNVIKDHQNKKTIPMQLYNILAKNSKGFFVINKNITEDDKNRFGDKNIKSILKFCMIHKDGFGLCGTGSLIRNIDGKEVDFTPYILKSLESMELGVKE